MVDLNVTGHGGISKDSGILPNVSNPSQVQVKSFCEVGKIARLFRAFDDAKRQLVRSIGFDGLLKTPFIDRLDNKFSMWLMSCLDPKTMILGFPNGESLALKDVDAHFVLGIPFRGNQVSHDNRHDKDVVSNVLGKLSIGGHKARLTLEYLEWILVKEYGDKFLPEEKVAFKIAVVLYSMACFLAAHGPKTSFPIWLFGNFVGSSKIHEYNWCGYILSVLGHGAMQLQDQLRNGDDLVKLYGCTFLLQVLYLDNMDFGPSSAAHLDIPRGNVYNTLYMKHLIDIDSEKRAGSEVVEYGRHKLRVGSEVCYSRGWEGPSFGKWGEYESNYVSTSEMFHNIILYDEKLALRLAGSLCKISANMSADIRKTYKSWYTEYKAIFSALPAGTFFPSNVSNLGKEVGHSCRTSKDGSPSKRARNVLHQQAATNTEYRISAKSGGECNQSALELLAEEATRTHGRQSSITNTAHNNGFVWVDGFLKKLVREHSKFPKSPFELG